MAGQLVKRGDRTWTVRVFVGRDGKGKRQYHNKTVHGNKDERLFNLPSNFSLPAYSPTPGGAATNVTYGDTNVHVNMTVTGGQSPDAVKDMVVAAITEALDSQMASQRW